MFERDPDTIWRAADVAARLSKPGKGASRKSSGGWMACCPAHDDTRPSLRLTDGRNGLIWHCHSGCRQEEVLEALKSVMGPSAAPVRALPSHKRTRVEDPKQVIPATFAAQRELSQGGALEAFSLGAHGLPARVWLYHDAAGKVMGAVARYETPEGKRVFPWCWTTDRLTGEEKWSNRAMPAPRPLYDSHRIAAELEKPILYVEGERAADAARDLFPNWIVTTHAGGAAAVDKADLTLLAGRTVIIHPDADTAGEQMFQRLFNRIADTAARVLRLEWPTTWPDGTPYQIEEGDDAWDHLARGWTYEKLSQIRETGHQLLTRAEVTVPFGRTDELGGCVVTVTDRVARIEAKGRDAQYREVGAVQDWQRVGGELEAWYNHRLQRQGHEPGRFPVSAGKVDVAAFIGFELASLGEAMGAGVELRDWMKRSTYQRQSLMRSFLEAEWAKAKAA